MALIGLSVEKITLNDSLVNNEVLIQREAISFLALHELVVESDIDFSRITRKFGKFETHLIGIRATAQLLSSRSLCFSRGLGDKR